MMAQHRAAPATLTREQVVAIVLEHCSRQFPRPCPTWADRFATLGEADAAIRKLRASDEWRGWDLIVADAVKNPSWT